jgi:hypothetical protein
MVSNDAQSVGWIWRHQRPQPFLADLCRDVVTEQLN